MVEKVKGYQESEQVKDSGLKEYSVSKAEVSEPQTAVESCFSSELTINLGNFQSLRIFVSKKAADLETAKTEIYEDMSILYKEFKRRHQEFIGG